MSVTANKIVTIRGKLSLSQAKAARLIGVQQNTWSRWEQGVQSPGTVDAELVLALPSIVQHGFPPPCQKLPKQWSSVVPHSAGCHRCRRLLFYIARMAEESV